MPVKSNSEVSSVVGSFRTLAASMSGSAKRELAPCVGNSAKIRDALTHSTPCAGSPWREAQTCYSGQFPQGHAHADGAGGVQHALVPDTVALSHFTA